ncbi:MAG: zinc ribbon domain-containing protein [Pirellulales bacterium]|nr:zinc ribbon domain-containing protein [Pirellulales bacterium]
MADVLTKCSVCQSLLDEEDLFCANCGTEAPARADGVGPADTSRLATHNFECAGCGASMSFDAQAGSLRCPFCGSVDLRQRKDAKILAPRRVVPFAVEREQAVATMRRWLGRGFFRPGDLSERAAVVKMTPVYVPYWVFDATTHTYWTADTSDTPSGARGDWYPMSGEHRGNYAGLLVGASGVLAPAETSALCPFDLAAGVAPDQVDLDNVTVEQFAVPRKYARPLARAGIEQQEATACQASYVPARARNVHVNVRIEALSGEPVLLPIWVMAYRYGDRAYRFLVNGQTGRATGSAPTSWAKVALVVAAVAVGAAVILGVIAAAQ